MRPQSALKITGGPANLGDKQSDTEGRCSLISVGRAVLSVTESMRFERTFPGSESGFLLRVSGTAGNFPFPHTFHTLPRALPTKPLNSTPTGHRADRLATSRSIFRALATRKDPRKVAEINGLRIKSLAQRAHSAPISRAKGSDSIANILVSYANINRDKIWEPAPAPGMNGKFGPAELGDRQEVTEGRCVEKILVHDQLQKGIGYTYVIRGGLT
jgi:hypothetical protein